MRIKNWHISGLTFIIVFGVFLHYAYDLSEQNRIVGYFAPINESVWEHLKLIFWPSFFFSVIEYFAYGKKEPDFFSVKMCGIFAALSFVVIVFYTYSGILGFVLFVIDILIFVLSALICQWISYRLLIRETYADPSDNLRSFVVLLLFALCFFVWTENPPMLAIFWG